MNTSRYTRSNVRRRLYASGAMRSGDALYDRYKAAEARAQLTVSPIIERDGYTHNPLNREQVRTLLTWASAANELTGGAKTYALATVMARLEQAIPCSTKPQIKLSCAFDATIVLESIYSQWHTQGAVVSDFFTSWVMSLLQNHQASYGMISGQMATALDIDPRRRVRFVKMRVGEEWFAAAIRFDDNNDGLYWSKFTMMVSLNQHGIIEQAAE